jgi:hypothetical protein
MMIVTLAGSGMSQSLLLRDGQQGPFIQGGYLGSVHFNGFGFDLGYATSNHFDLGISLAHAREKNPFNIYDTHPREERNLGGQFANWYPVRAGNERVEGILGIHESYAFTFDDNRDPSLTFGATANVLTRIEERGGVAASLGYARARQTESGFVQDIVLLGLETFVERKDRYFFGIVFSYNLSDADDSYSIGFDYCYVI